ncbi:MAG: phosphate signaling complex protein PhoU [Elusimicrobiota bacterium]
MLEKRIIDLKKDLVEYANLVESMIKNAVNGYLTKNTILLKSIIDVTEPKTNQFELDIEELCTSAIAKFDPKAVDLRTILMILKMNNDLERIADHAVNISESAIFIIENSGLEFKADLTGAATVVSSMLHDTITAFINEDTNLAKAVCREDNKVDSFRLETIKEMVKDMSENPNIVEKCLHFLRISSNLERMADLCTNMSEDVVFMVEGKIIKHHGKDAS